MSDTPFNFDAVCESLGGYSGNPKSDPEAAYDRGLADMLRRAKETLELLLSDAPEAVNELEGGMVVKHPTTFKWVLVVGYGKDNRKFANCFHQRSKSGKVLPRVFPTAEAAADALEAAIEHMAAGGIETDLKAYLEFQRSRFIKKAA